MTATITLSCKGSGRDGPFHLTFLSLPESWFLYVKNETSAVNAQDGADGSQHAPV